MLNFKTPTTNYLRLNEQPTTLLFSTFSLIIQYIQNFIFSPLETNVKVRNKYIHKISIYANQEQPFFSNIQVVPLAILLGIILGKYMETSSGFHPWHLDINPTIRLLLPLS